MIAYLMWVFNDSHILWLKSVYWQISSHQLGESFSVVYENRASIYLLKTLFYLLHALRGAIVGSQTQFFRLLDRRVSRYTTIAICFGT